MFFSIFDLSLTPGKYRYGPNGHTYIKLDLNHNSGRSFRL